MSNIIINIISDFLKLFFFDHKKCLYFLINIKRINDDDIN